MKIIDQDGATRFIFRGVGRAGALLASQVGAMILMVGVFLYVAFSLPDETAALVVFGAFSCCLLYFAWRLLRRITLKEELIVSGSEITVISVVNGRKKQQRYPLKEISNLCFIGDGYSPVHPLASDHFDAMGFGGRQAMVNVVAEEGNIAFYYDAKLVRFGTRVPSWDAEKIGTVIRERSGDEIQMAGLPKEISDSVWNRDARRG